MAPSCPARLQPIVHRIAQPDQAHANQDHILASITKIWLGSSITVAAARAATGLRARPQREEARAGGSKRTGSGKATCISEEEARQITQTSR